MSVGMRDVHSPGELIGQPLMLPLNAQSQTREKIPDVAEYTEAHSFGVEAWETFPSFSVWTLIVSTPRRSQQIHGIAAC